MRDEIAGRKFDMGVFTSGEESGVGSDELVTIRSFSAFPGAKDADIMILVTSRPSEDLMAVYDARHSTVIFSAGHGRRRSPGRRNSVGHALKELSLVCYFLYCGSSRDMIRA